MGWSGTLLARERATAGSLGLANGRVAHAELRMISRRDFLQVAAAIRAALLTPAGPTPRGRAAAQRLLPRRTLLRFEPLGNVTLLHLTDIHAQLVPLLFREPAVNIGVGEEQGLGAACGGQGISRDLSEIAAGTAIGPCADLR